MRIRSVSPVAAFMLSLLSSVLLSLFTCLSSAAEYLLTASALVISRHLSSVTFSPELRLKMKTAGLSLICVLLVSKIYQTTQDEVRRKNNSYTYSSNIGSIEVFIEGTALKFVLNNERGKGKVILPDLRCAPNQRTFLQQIRSDGDNLRQIRNQ